VDVIDGKLVLAVDQRLEPAPRVLGQTPHELAVADGQGPAASARGARHETRSHVWPRRLFTAHRGLPGLLSPRDDGLDGIGLDPPADDLIPQLAPRLAVKKQACDISQLADQARVRICTDGAMG
jgi:hypothetical protein